MPQAKPQRIEANICRLPFIQKTRLFSFLLQQNYRVNSNPGILLFANEWQKDLVEKVLREHDLSRDILSILALK